MTRPIFIHESCRELFHTSRQVECCDRCRGRVVNTCIREVLEHVDALHLHAGGAKGKLCCYDAFKTLQWNYMCYPCIEQVKPIMVEIMKMTEQREAGSQ